MMDADSRLIEGHVVKDICGRPTRYAYRLLSGERHVVDVNPAACLETLMLQEVFRLTPQQARALQLLFGRRTNREIAHALDVSEHTARRHVESVLFKIGAHSRTEVEEIVVGRIMPMLIPATLNPDHVPVEDGEPRLRAS